MLAKPSFLEAHTMSHSNVYKRYIGYIYTHIGGILKFLSLKAYISKIDKKVNE